MHAERDEAPPVVVVLDDRDTWRAAVAETRLRGWTVHDDGGAAAPGPTVVAGDVSSSEDAACAVRRVLEGGGLVVLAPGSEGFTHDLCDDLRHLGPLDVRTTPVEEPDPLGVEERRILELLATGMPLARVAEDVGMSRRTIARRLAHIRDALGVDTTAEAIHAALGS